MNMEFIESPIKYVGGKYKLLNQIIPLFPEDINRFVDLFCGSGVVGANMMGRAKEVICIDKDVNIIQLLYHIAKYKAFFLEQVERVIANYGLSNSYRFGLDKYKQVTGYGGAGKALSAYNKEAYKVVRKDFNFHNATSLFYVLNLYGYTGAGRYNSRSKHNISVGNSDLNIKVVKRYRKYCEYINKSKSPASYVAVISGNITYTMMILFMQTLHTYKQQQATIITGQKKTLSRYLLNY
ncbi:DNA adenine methylase [Mucispirillum schaedleri]|uniref:DNA adenine methylase n=1 Tax=Mucispirillum schaedleri TaxID=248039 RepID=UPI001F58F3F6|nr:DNA adenine methylase [Mucispirillum schaedleri]